MQNDREMYLLSFDEARSNELLIRKFLLSKASKVRYTMRHEGWGCGLLIILPFILPPKNYFRDMKFKETIKNLGKDFIEQKIDNTLYNDVANSRNSRFHHYFYRLSKNTTAEINKMTLLDSPYGFEDPTFYIDDLMIGSIISHEPVFVLYLTQEERRSLNQKGIVFETIEDNL
ncbi:MAG: hypothetical protein WCG48_03085 [Candidatus Berkelbacteria bacterium]